MISRRRFLRGSTAVALSALLTLPLSTAARAGVQPSAIWRVRPSGVNTNGGGYDPGISGAGTDYSQQDAAQASGTNGVTTGTTTFTDATAAAFTALMVGNAIYITGSGQTTGWYFVISRTSANAVVLDRSPGTGIGATWALGGGWADPITNTTSAGPLVPGNIVYILGSGVPNPASYTFDYTLTSSSRLQVGNQTVGSIMIANDPQTPGYKAAPDTTGGMPCIKVNGQLFAGPGGSGASPSFVKISGLWVVANNTAVNNIVYRMSEAAYFGCVTDQNGQDVSMAAYDVPNISVFGCEVFSSVAPGSPGSSYAIFPFNGIMIGCNIHDTVGGGLKPAQDVDDFNTIEECVIANCRGNGIYVTGIARIKNNTIDANLGNGIEFTTQALLSGSFVMNNIITNHTQASTYGFTVDAGTAIENITIIHLADYNTYYGNTTDLNAISYGPHDTHGGSNPYVGQSTENYTLANLSSPANDNAVQIARAKELIHERREAQVRHTRVVRVEEAVERAA